MFKPVLYLLIVLLIINAWLLYNNPCSWFNGVAVGYVAATLVNVFRLEYMNSKGGE